MRFLPFALRSAASAALVFTTFAVAARADSVVGQVVNASGVGLVGITLKFSNGLPNAVTGTNGLFAVTVPAGRYDIAFEPSATYAPRILLDVQVAGTANLGALRLETGFVISGRVVNTATLPVVGANIDVYDQVTGVKFYTPGDGTDVAGNFAVTVPVGTSRVRVKAPTGSSLVAWERADVVVQGAVVLGQITLQPGFVVSGVVLDATTSLPVVDVDLDVVDAMSGVEVTTPDDNTNSVGAFSLVVPGGLLHVALDPPAGNNLLARRMLNLYVTGPRNLGNVTLARGSLVRGRVLTANNVPVANADIDAELAPGIDEIYLSHDKTDSSGNFEIVVPDGNYRFVADPPAAVGVIGARTAATGVSGTTVLPDFVLPAGVRVSGVVRGPDGSPEAGVNLDFISSSSGELVTPGDRTDANGFYDAVVANGTYDVVFTPARGRQARVDTATAEVVNGNRTLDRSLTRVPAFVHTQGFGIPALPIGDSVPALVTFGNPNGTVTSTRLVLTFVDAAGNRLTILSLDLVFPPAVLVTNLLFLPVPPVNPIYLGRIGRYEVRFADPVTGQEHDRDSFDFVIR